MFQAAVRGFGGARRLVSLPALEELGWGSVRRLPQSIRIVLESLLRHAGTGAVREEDARRLAAWTPRGERRQEIPFTVSRVLLQDFTGVPLLVDLAAMRAAVARLGGKAARVEPVIPVDLVVDHSLQMDVTGRPDAMELNMDLEFRRNAERYAFLKWGQGAFRTFKVVPPGTGIIHQVNLESLARVVFSRGCDCGNLYYPDTLVGTDSHTTMIGGLGVVGWGVGGIEAEAAMLAEPVTFLTPDVVGVRLEGRLPAGVTATDLALRVTELLRKEKVVGAFVEFFGEGAAALRLEDRATVANMAPEYGATIGYFGVDGRTLDYLRETGRPEKLVQDVEDYFRAQGLFGIPEPDAIDYTRVVRLDLSGIAPVVAGPKRPQDVIALPALPARFRGLLEKPAADGGYGRGGAPAPAGTLGDGSVVIAAITSCTNTSNPDVMLAAGLVARKAAERGLRPPAFVKTSLVPGSRAAAVYLRKAGLMEGLETIGFHIAGYGCGTCIGNSGPLNPGVEEAVKKDGLVVAGVLSGNRNFEARVHAAVKANFLASPPLVVAYALAGTVDLDLAKDPLGRDAAGRPVTLADLWPSPEEMAQARGALGPDAYAAQAADTGRWAAVPSASGPLYPWDEASTYIQHPPFLEGVVREPPKGLSALAGLRPLLILGDSVTTDHISPAGSIGADSPAGRFLVAAGVAKADFNSYGARRGNDRVMVRGTFANSRLKNLMAGGKEGGFTTLQPAGTPTTIFEASEAYRKAGVPLIVVAGLDYGMGSSRDWAAKGTALLGVRVVLAASYERIHRSNLVGMGVLPLQFPEGVTAATLGLAGTETFDLPGLAALAPAGTTRLVIRRADGRVEDLQVLVRVDSGHELALLAQGGILPAMLRRMLA